MILFYRTVIFEMDILNFAIDKGQAGKTDD
jgi:hypothetical protein